MDEKTKDGINYMKLGLEIMVLALFARLLLKLLGY